MSVENRLLCGTHGASEMLAHYVREVVEKYEIDGVMPYNPHPLALALGVRVVGDGEQLMARYEVDDAPVTANQPLDEDDLAARRTKRWIGKTAGNPDKIVTDVHDTIMPGSSFFTVGWKASQATIAAGYLLGFTRCVLEPTPFTDCFPNAMSCEESITNPEDYDCAVDGWYAGLRELSKYDASELRLLYQSIKHNLKYYRAFAIPTFEAGTETKLAPYIPELEAIHVERAFQPVTLPLSICQSLGVNACTDSVYYPRSWGHINMSDEDSRLGITNDGVIRRKYFGSICYEIDGPLDEGQWAYFKPEAA